MSVLSSHADSRRLPSIQSSQGPAIYPPVQSSHTPAIYPMCQVGAEILPPINRLFKAATVPPFTHQIREAMLNLPPVQSRQAPAVYPLGQSSHATAIYPPGLLVSLGWVVLLG